jgi:hypothetical protein
MNIAPQIGQYPITLQTVKAGFFRLHALNMHGSRNTDFEMLAGFEDILRTNTFTAEFGAVRCGIVVPEAAVSHQPLNLQKPPTNDKLCI